MADNNNNNDEKDSLDKECLGHVVESVSFKYPSDLKITLDEACQKVLLEYLDEVTLAVVEQSALLANHRGSNIVETEDIQLILEKKLGIKVPGAITQPLYKNSYHTAGLKDKKSKGKDDAKSESTPKRGTKRKANN